MIYESRNEEYISGGNITLAPNALRVLEHLGVYDKIRLEGFNYEDIWSANGAGVTLGHFLNGSQKKYNFQAICIPRTKVRDVLREQYRLQGVEILYEKRCANVSETVKDKVSVIFSDGEIVNADFVIGGDGIHSHVRSHLTPTAEAPHFSRLMCIMGHVPASDVEHIEHSFGLPAMLFGDFGSFAIMPSSYSGDEIGYFATLETEDRSREGWESLGRNAQELKMLEDIFVGEQSNWPEFFQALNQKTPAETLTCWPFFVAPHLDNWVSKSGRVFLIGDSAHAIPPTGGQGAAMALEDAETVAYLFAELATPFERGQDKQIRLMALTSKWNAHRQGRITKVLDFTTKNRTLRKSSPHYYEQAAKEWIIWAALKFRGSEGGAQWMYEYSAEDVRADLI